MSNREGAFVGAGVIGGILAAVAGFFCGRPGIGALALAIAIASFAYGCLRQAHEERRLEAEIRDKNRLAEYRAQQARSALAGVVIVARRVPAPVVVIAPPSPPLLRPILFDTPEQMEARFLAFLGKPAAAPAARKPVARITRTVRVTQTTVTFTRHERKG
jgi:hypothetical protein